MWSFAGSRVWKKPDEMFWRAFDICAVSLPWAAPPGTYRGGRSLHQDGFHEWPSFSMIPHCLFLIHQIMLVSFKFSTILPLSLSSLTLTPALTASYQMYHYQRQRAKCFIFYFFSKIHSLNSFIAIPRLNPSFPRSKAPKIARGPGLSQRRTRRPRPPLRTTKTHPDADDSNEDLRLARIMSETRNW